MQFVTPPKKKLFRQLEVILHLRLFTVAKEFFLTDDYFSVNCCYSLKSINSTLQLFGQ